MASESGNRARAIAKWLLQHEPVDGKSVVIEIEKSGLLTFSFGEEACSIRPGEWEGLWMSVVIGAVVAGNLGLET